MGRRIYHVRSSSSNGIVTGVHPDNLLDLALRGRPLKARLRLRRLIESKHCSLCQYWCDCDSDHCRYVLNAARAAKSDDPNHSQRVIYVSVSDLDLVQPRGTS